MLRDLTHMNVYTGAYKQGVYEQVACIKGRTKGYTKVRAKVRAKVVDKGVDKACTKVCRGV